MLPFTANLRVARGARAERQAARFLQHRGLKLLARNYHCRFGEIDLVMIDRQDCLVFVEVRLRRDSDYASALQSIDWRKQDKIRKAALSFLAGRPRLQRLAARFDVVAIQQENQRQKVSIDWIKNAFQ